MKRFHLLILLFAGLLIFNQTELLAQKLPSYDSMWAEVALLKNEGRTATAIDRTRAILEKARKEGNDPQKIKAIIHTMYFSSLKDEEFDIMALKEMESEIIQARQPGRSILHSAIAEMYWWYFQQNQWAILQRTESDDEVTDDIKTWTAKDLVLKADQHYNQSLENGDFLKKSPPADFDLIWVKAEEGRILRPTLYDVLLHRALEFYKDNRTGIVVPRDQFSIDDRKFFLPAPDFVSLEHADVGYLSFELRAIELYRDVIAFHMSAGNTDAMVYDDLERLKYVYGKFAGADRDSLYEKALINLKDGHAKSEISTEVIFDLASHYARKGGQYSALHNPECQWSLRDAVAMCDEATIKFPQSRGAKLCINLKENLSESGLTVEMENITYPNKEMLYTVSYKNLKKVHFRIVSNRENILVKKARKDVQYDLPYFLAKKAIREWTVELPDLEDYQYHRIELWTEGLKEGYYVLIASMDPKFKTSENLMVKNFFWTSSMAYFFAQENEGGARIFAADRKSGHALKGVKINLFQESYNYERRGVDLIDAGAMTTDADGKAIMPPGSEMKNYRVLLSKGRDSLMMSNAIYIRKFSENKSKPYFRTAIFTDRAVYRPGQSIYFKGLLMQKEALETSIVAGHQMTVKLYDVNHQEISRTEFTTSEFGTYHGSFQLPASVLTGRFYIDDGSSRYQIMVEEYKRPSFFIEMKPIEENIQLGQEITVSGMAKSLNGVPLSNASGSFHVERNTSFAMPYRYFRYYPATQKAEIGHGDFEIDEKGNFSFTFLAVPDKQVSKESLPVFRFKAGIVVSDISGETQEQEVNLSIGYHSLQLSLLVDAEVNKNEVDSLPLSTTNLMNVFTPAEVQVEIYTLVAPSGPLKERLWEEADLKSIAPETFKKLFPFDAMGGEASIENWQVGTLALSNRVNTKELRKLSLRELKTWTSGAYLVKLKSTDPFGQQVDWEKRFVLFGQDDKSLGLPAFSWSKLLTPECHVGEKARLMMGTSFKDGRIYLTVSNKYGQISGTWMDLKAEGLQIVEHQVTEEDRGSLTFQFVFIHEGRLRVEQHTVNVPLDNKRLQVKLETMRKEMRPGDIETWRIVVRDNMGNPANAEVLASMYDVSLDVYKPNIWAFNPHSYPSPHIYWNMGNNFQASHGQYHPFFNKEYKHIPQRTFDQLNWFGFGFGGRHYTYERSATPELMDDGGYAETKIQADKAMTLDENLTEAELAEEVQEDMQEESVKTELRTDFRETAFFYPELKTSDKGASEFTFDVPDALTKWKLQVLAVTKDLQYGLLTEQFVTKKELMVVPNYPRFLTAGDTLNFSAKVTNLTDEEMTTRVNISVVNPWTGDEMNEVFPDASAKSIVIAAGQNQVVRWQLVAPENIGMLEIAVYASSKAHRDGESRSLPVLSKSILVTESYPVSLRPGEKKTVDVKKLGESNQQLGIEAKRLTVEFAPNPAWYIVQALPYLADIGNESCEQLFNRYYANSLAFHIAGSNQGIQKVFDLWKKSSPDAFRSKLETNAELKNIVLNETPWLLDARNEAEDKQKIANFFDENNMKNALSSSIFELNQSQTSNGGWPWFKGMEDNRFITQHIVLGMGRLSHLGIKSIRQDQQLWTKLQLAVNYTDQRINEDYRYIIKELKNKEANHLSSLHIQYLYARSLYKDVELNANCKEAYDYFTDQARTYWLSQNKYMQAMIAVTFFRKGEVEFAEKILTSLKENAIYSDEFGMYWKKELGYYWYQSDIEKQAMIIEAFEEVGKDQKSVDEMKIWLLKQKQTKMWRTGKATAEACYAMLLRGTDLLSQSNTLSISVGKENFVLPIADGTSEAGTSYTKMTWEGSAIKNDMSQIIVENQGTSVSWGATYFQFFQSADRIETAASALSLTREIYVKRYNKEGALLKRVNESVHLETGDVVVIKMIITTDRDLEFVHLKDMRAAGLEPASMTSGYRYSGGLGHYLSIRDAANHFYFSHLVKGTYVLEYELKASNSGSFSTGIATIQSFYAPEFSAHSRGQRIVVE